MNTITISLSEKDRDILEHLKNSINLLATTIGSAQPREVREAIIEKVNAAGAALLQETEVSIGLPVEGAAHLEPVTVEPEIPAPVEEAPTTDPVTLAEFQKAVTLAVSKSAEAKKAVKALINKYAASVSAVPEDKRAEVMAELANI